jgi:hypothetical protein
MQQQLWRGIARRIGSWEWRLQRLACAPLLGTALHNPFAVYLTLPVLPIWMCALNSWDLDLALDVLHAPLTRESHSHGVRLKEFEANAALAEFYKPLSLSVDREGRVSWQVVVIAQGIGQQNTPTPSSLLVNQGQMQGWLQAVPAAHPPLYKQRRCCNCVSQTSPTAVTSPPLRQPCDML